MALRQVGPSLASHGAAGRGRDTWATVAVLAHKAISPGSSASASSSTPWSSWTLSDLGGAEVRLALFGSAAAAHFATSEGTAVLLVGCRPSRHREERKSSGGGGGPASSSPPRITADAAACIILLGTAAEYARCAARTRAGDRCTRAVNASVCPVCDIHAPGALARLRSRQGCLSDSGLAAHVARGVRAGAARRPRAGGAGCAAVAAATAPRLHAPEEAVAAAAAAYTGRSRPSYGVRVVTSHVTSTAAAAVEEAAAKAAKAAKAVAAEEARTSICLTPGDTAGGADPAVARAALAARLRARVAETAGAVSRGADAGTVAAARAAAAAAASAVARRAAGRAAAAAAAVAPSGGAGPSAFAAAFAGVVGEGEGGNGASGSAPATTSLYGPGAADSAFLGPALDRLAAAEALASAASGRTSAPVRAVTCSICAYTAERPRPTCVAAGHGPGGKGWTWGPATKRWWACDACGWRATALGGRPPRGCNRCGPGAASFTRTTAGGKGPDEAADAKRRRVLGDTGGPVGRADFLPRGEERPWVG